MLSERSTVYHWWTTTSKKWIRNFCNYNRTHSLRLAWSLWKWSWI